MARPVAAADFGTPHVLSQQGQRLRIVVPVRAAPDEKVTAASITVSHVEVPPGFQAPSAAGFTVMQPMSRQYLVLVSREVVDAPTVSLALNRTEPVQLALPHLQMAPPQMLAHDGRPVAVRPALARRALPRPARLARTRPAAAPVAAVEAAH